MTWNHFSQDIRQHPEPRWKTIGDSGEVDVPDCLLCEDSENVEKEAGEWFCHTCGHFVEGAI